MSVDRVKTCLTDRGRIHTLATALLRGGYSRSDVYNKITNLCHVDLDLLNEVLGAGELSN